jgi:hypothetical protein
MYKFDFAKLKKKWYKEFNLSDHVILYMSDCDNITGYYNFSTESGEIFFF